MDKLIESTLLELKNMLPGSQIKVATTSLGRQDVQAMIDLSKEFIDNGNYDYEFSNDYRFIKRLSFKF